MVANCNTVVDDIDEDATAVPSSAKVPLLVLGSTTRSPPPRGMSHNDNCTSDGSDDDDDDDNDPYLMKREGSSDEADVRRPPNETLP